MIYDYSLKLADGSILNLAKFKNKVLLIINIATRCGYTKQLKDIEILHQKYKNQGLVIIGVPSNEFFRQSPEDDLGIKSFCELNYNTTFLLTTKTKVNTKNADPLFIHLREKTMLKKIPWNFSKFLINKDGTTICHYPAKKLPLELENEIIQLIKA